MIVVKKQTGTIQTFNHKCFKICQRFASAPEASSGHTKISHKSVNKEF